MLALHLLQSALVHLNTLLIQRVLDGPAWAGRLTDEDRRGLTPLFWSNINPYGTFHLDMSTRLDLEGAGEAVARPDRGHRMGYFAPGDTNPSTGLLQASVLQRGVPRVPNPSRPVMRARSLQTVERGGPVNHQL